MHVIRAETVPLSVSPLILQGIADLQEIAFSHRSATYGAKILEAVGQGYVGQGHISLHSLWGSEASTKDPADPSRHFRASINFLPSDMESFQPASNSATRQSIFSPFPSQVLPLAVRAEQLKTCGFELSRRYSI
jgi:hypothetical protein